MKKYTYYCDICGESETIKDFYPLKWRKFKSKDYCHKCKRLIGHIPLNLSQEKLSRLLNIRRVV